MSAQSEAVTGRMPDATGHALLAIGVVLGVTSIVLYATMGYTVVTGLSWIASLVILALVFESRSQRLPRIATSDLVAPTLIALALAPLYLVKVYDWPVQVGSDEISIMTAAERWAHRGDSDLFGLSDYLGHPALLFVVWGKLGELFGGIDLGTMRAIHGAVSLLAVAASYFLFRQLMPRRWAIVAVLLLGLSHSLFMISRLAMRETSALLVEVVALALLLRGLRHRAPFPTFLGGAVAGLGYYVYQPARSIIVLWLLFLVVLFAFARERVPARRLAGSAAVALSAFALVAAPVVIAELKAPADQATLSRESLLVFDDARQLQRDWVFAESEWEGVRTNIGYGLGAFNSNVVDHGWIYINYGHGLVDPLTGVLLWIGVLVVGWRVIRGKDALALLPLTALLSLWLSFALLVNKAPNYTRLLVLLPFVAYFVTQAIRAAAGLVPRFLKRRDRRGGRVAAVMAAGVIVAAIGVWNVAIAADYVDKGRTEGDDIGSTGRYVESRRDVAGIRFYLAASDASPYYIWGLPHMWQDRLRMFAREGQVQPTVPPAGLGRFGARPPFVLLLSGALWERERAALERRYPQGGIHNVTPDGAHLAFEVPAG
ncbi:MAG: hypothetical protein ABWY51_06320 [Gaiellaceae bacterium]